MDYRYRQNDPPKTATRPGLVTTDRAIISAAAASSNGLPAPAYHLDNKNSEKRKSQRERPRAFLSGPPPPVVSSHGFLRSALREPAASGSPRFPRTIIEARHLPSVSARRRRDDIVVEEEPEASCGVGGRTVRRDVERHRERVRPERVCARQRRRSPVGGRQPKTIAERYGSAFQLSRSIPFIGDPTCCVDLELSAPS